MPNNDDVNAILQQLRARTEQRLNSDSAPAAAAEKPAVSSSAGSDADKLLEQLRAQREQTQPSAPAPAPAETAVLPPMPKAEAEETAVTHTDGDDIERHVGHHLLRLKCNAEDTLRKRQR